MDSIRSILIYLRAFIAFFTIAPILIIVILVCPPVRYKVLVLFCRFMIFVFGCKLVVNGKFPKNQFFVIMANHVSFLDVFAVPCVLEGNFSAVAASKNFQIPIYSSILKIMKVVSINRSNKENAIEGITQAQEVLKSGYHIVILPEGTRTTTGNLLPFKKGGFHLARNTQANILPIITKGLFSIKPKNRWTIQPGIIEINILKPINVKDKEVDLLLDETYKSFIDNF